MNIGTFEPRLMEAMRPDVMLMGVQMPDTDPTETITRITTTFPRATVIPLPCEAGEQTTRRFIGPGAARCFRKDVRGAEVLGAVHGECRSISRSTLSGRDDRMQADPSDLTHHTCDASPSLREDDGRAA